MTTQDANTTEQQNPAAELRAYAERVAAENKQLRQRVLEGDIAKLGLSTEEGLGVAVVDNYDGELEYKALAQWVKDKYRYEAPVTAAEEEATAAIAAESIAAAEAVADQVHGISDSVQPADADTAAQQIESKMFDPEAGEQEAVASLVSKLDRFVNQ